MVLDAEIAERRDQQEGENRIELAIWFVLAAMVLWLGLFRREAVAMRVLAVIVFLSGLASDGCRIMAAAERDHACNPISFEVALEMIETGRARDAVFLMQDPVWRGIAEYRAEAVPACAGRDDPGRRAF